MRTRRSIEGVLLLIILAFSCLAYEVNVDCGADTDLELDGIVWQADREYEVGNWGFIGGEAEPTFVAVDCSRWFQLHQTQRRGVSECRFDVTPGWYKINMRFSETEFHGKGMRVMDVLIEGDTVLADFDIYTWRDKDHGIPFFFYKQVFDSVLNIEFLSSIGRPAVSSIAVLTVDVDTIPPECPRYPMKPISICGMKTIGTEIWLASISTERQTQSGQGSQTSHSICFPILTGMLRLARPTPIESVLLMCMVMKAHCHISKHQ